MEATASGRSLREIAHEAGSRTRCCTRRSTTVRGRARTADALVGLRFASAGSAGNALDVIESALAVVAEPQTLDGPIS